MLQLEDENPHVVAHACSSLTNFMEGALVDVSTLYADKFLPKLFEKLQLTGVVAQHAMTAIAALADSAKEHFRAYH